MCGSSRTEPRAGRLGLLGWLLASGCATLGAEVGPAPEQVYALCLPRVGGGGVCLSEFRGQVLMVDLFVTWAHSSSLDIPGYTVLESRLGPRGLAVVGVALDEITQVVEPFVRGMEVSYPVGLADRAVRSGASALGPVEVLPKLLVFDRRGRLRAVFLGQVPPDRLEAVILDLL
jgi:hypothetical protein